jgi:U2 small nuclear ribonucleoprotein B''
MSEAVCFLIYYLQIFSKFGPCDVVAMSSLARRGQAWITYETIEQATAALESLHGQSAFSKKLRVSFARNVSDVTRVRKGLPPRQKRVKPFTKAIVPESTAMETEGISSRNQTSMDFFRTDQAAPKIPATRAYNPPNKLIMVEDIPSGITDDELSHIFGKHPGFVEVRHIPSRGMAFVEFGDQNQSEFAMSQLGNLQIKPGCFVKLSYAKR